MSSCILHVATEESPPSQVFVCSLYKEERQGNKYWELDQQLWTWDKRTKEHLETTLSDAMSPKAIIMLFLPRWLKNLKALIFCFLVSKEDVPSYEKAPQPPSTLTDWEESRPLLKTLKWRGHMIYQFLLLTFCRTMCIFVRGSIWDHSLVIIISRQMLVTSQVLEIQEVPDCPTL